MGIAELLSWFQFPLGEAAFFAVFGLLFVVFGIVVLVLIFTLLGLVMKKISKREKKVRNKKRTQPDAQQSFGVEQSEDDPELVAVLMAAIAAYYEQENVKCDFVVRRIKKL